MLLVVSQLFLLFALESAHTFEHLVPINQSSVELWSIDADELCLASDGESACTAHTCTVNHDGVERYLARDVVLLSCKVRELHHDWRANGEYLIHVWLLFDKLLDTNGYYTFLAVATVVGHDDHLVTTLAYLVFKDDKVFRASGHY